MVNIKDLNKAEVLKALWDHSHCQGMSYMALMGKGSITLADAQELVSNTPRLYFDYVAGHVIKCDISGDEFDERLYDRDCGEGMAQRAIDAVRREKELMDHPYQGGLITVKIENCYNNNAIAEAIHNSFEGRDDYRSNAVILNKDPDSTTGKEQTSVYILMDDLTDRNGIHDALNNVLKSIYSIYDSYKTNGGKQ